MRLRIFTAVLVAPVLVLAACDGDSPTVPDTSNNVTVQFINASNTSLEVATHDTLATGGGPLGYGTASRCMTVDATRSGLAVRTPGTNSIVDFRPVFTGGGSYSVIMYPGTTNATQFATVSNGFTPASGQAGLRVVNLGPAGSNYDVYVGAPGAALGTASASSLAVGTVSNFFNVSPTATLQITLTNAGTKTVAAGYGTSSFTAGKLLTLVITPMPTNSALVGGFFTPGC